MKKLLILIATCLFAGILTGAFAQSAGQDMKDAGHDTKEAAKDVGKGTAKAAKTTGHKTKKVVKRATHAAASETEEGADKVKEKTR